MACPMSYYGKKAPAVFCPQSLSYPKYFCTHLAPYFWDPLSWNMTLTVKCLGHHKQLNSTVEGYKCNFSDLNYLTVGR